MTDMRIDSKRIRQERERRAWSQQHLATVSGLSLRTVQRVEQTGAASFETAAALSACLELPPAPPVPGSPAMVRRSTALLGMVAAFLIGMILTVAPPVIAEDVAFDISVRKHETNDRDETGELIFELERIGFEQDQSRDIAVGETLHMTIRPRVLGDQVIISIALVGAADHEPHPFGIPVIVVKDGQPARISFGTRMDASGFGAPESRVNPIGRPPTAAGYSIQLIPAISTR